MRRIPTIIQLLKSVKQMLCRDQVKQEKNEIIKIPPEDMSKIANF